MKIMQVLFVFGLAVLLGIYIGYLKYCCAQSEPMPKWMKLSFVRHILKRNRWYRKWYGGVWEYWYIEMCMSSFWLHVPSDRRYPQYVPCSGHGTPIVEDYTVEATGTTDEKPVDKNQ
jgi:hypothetical protein